MNPALEQINKHYHLLDNKLDKALEPYLELASQITETEVSYISIFDEVKQYFIGTRGISLQPVDRKKSLCNQYILPNNESTFIDDLSQKKDIPKGVGYEAFGCYAGIPILDENNELLATFCVVGKVPKTFSDKEKSMFKILGIQLSDFLERRKTLITFYRKWDENYKRLVSEIYDMKKAKYRLAHDLKGPIGNLKGLSEAALANKDHYKAEDFIRLFEVMDTASGRLMTMLKDMLEKLIKDGENTILDDTKRIHGNLESINLANIINSILELNNYTHYGEYKVQINKLPIIHGISTDLYLILQNLIENALKYNKSTLKEITISSKKKGEEWVFSVSDNGIGIAEDQVDTIFKPKKRLDNGMDTEGTGLGLYNVKTIIEEYGNKIWVESDKKGSIFMFTWNAKQD